MIFETITSIFFTCSEGKMSKRQASPQPSTSRGRSRKLTRPEQIFAAFSEMSEEEDSDLDFFGSASEGSSSEEEYGDHPQGNGEALAGPPAALPAPLPPTLWLPDNGQAINPTYPKFPFL
jgi:hypothetical protein